jgi:hypothetical protein
LIGRKEGRERKEGKGRKGKEGRERKEGKGSSMTDKGPRQHVLLPAMGYPP